MRTAVLGAGSWGTAFAAVLADAGNEVTMWGRRPEVCTAISEGHVNPEYLPGIELPHSITATHDPQRSLEGAEIVALAVPAQSLRTNLGHWVAHIPPQALLLSLSKGIERSTALRMSEVIIELTGAPSERLAVVSGPTLAGEIAERQPSAAVVASADADVAQLVQSACHTGAFRAYTNVDIVGTELAGAVKNVIALAVGMAVGLGLGDNARASVITRGLAEITRLGAALGADAYTFSGLAGLGDLVATCSSPLSRNRTVGERMGRGESAAAITASSRQIAEGVDSCASVLELARRAGVEMPIAEHMSLVVAGQQSPEETVRTLLSRSAKPERHGH